MSRGEIEGLLACLKEFLGKQMRCVVTIPGVTAEEFSVELTPCSP